MAKYNEIRPLALKLIPGNARLKPSFRALPFPTAWKKALKTVMAEMYQKPEEKVNIPIRSLNKTLRTLAPDLISVIPNATSHEAADWLFCSTRIAPDILKLIVKAWITLEFTKASEPSRAFLLKVIDDEPIEWTSKTIDLTDWTVTNGGTAQERNGLVYSLLPEYIASLLCKPGIALEHNTVTFHLRRCPTAPGKNGAELVSWPPFYIDELKKTGPHSLLLTITVQTVPFQANPLVYIDLGIRRWVDANDLKGKLRGKTQVYMQTSVPWLPGLEHSQSFQVGRVRWRVLENESTEKEFVLAWEDRFGEILEILNPSHQLLEPEWFRQHIAQGLESDDGTNAAFVYNTRMGAHLAGGGLMPGDRHPIFESIIGLLKDYLVPEPLYPRSAYKASKPDNDFYDFKQQDEEICKKRRLRILQEIGEELCFEVHYQRADTAREIAAALCAFLGFEKPQSDEQCWEKDGLSVTLKCLSLGSLGSSLSLNPGIKNKTDQLNEAIQKRIDGVKLKLPAAHIPTLAIVELGGKDEFSGGTDPKNSLRLGFSETGRLSQFISASSDQPVEERAKMVILDGLRQLGMSPKISHVNSMSGHPENMNYVGIWIIKQNPKIGRNSVARYIPVMVHVDSQTAEVRASAYGFEEWTSYPNALLSLGCGHFQVFERLEHAQSYIQEFLGDLAAEGKPILLLCDAHNIRSVWKGMQNKLIQKDLVNIDGSVSYPISQYPGLRIIRIRGNQSHETPEWYALKEIENGDSEFGFSEGLFTVNERVFASLGAKPVQFKNLSKEISKFVATDDIKAKPKQSSWNPVIYEQTVAAMQKGDNPAVLAAIASELRQSSIQYDESTSLAVPLHLASLMGEYILNLPDEDDDTE